MIETIEGVTILQTIEPTTNLAFLYYVAIGFAFVAVFLSAIIISANDDWSVMIPLIMLLIFSSVLYGCLVVPRFAETKQSYRCRIETIDAYRELTEHYKVLDEYEGIYLVR